MWFGGASQAVARLKSHSVTKGSLYFLTYNAAIVALLPWLALLWKDLGFSGGQLGILAGLRPFISAVAGQLLTSVADARQLHFVIALTTYVVTFLCRGGMGVLYGFVAHVLLVMFSEACQAPFSIMSDAAAAATSTSEGEYGKRKLWASVGWGALAPLAGWIVEHYGVRASIAVYFALAVLSTVPLVLLPLEQLAKRSAGQAQAPPPSGPGNAAGSGGKAKAGMREPLLSEDQRWHGGKAAELAIELTDSLAEVAADGVTVQPAQDDQATEEQVPPVAAVQPSSGSDNWCIPAYGTATTPTATAALPISTSSAHALPPLRRPSLPPINTGHQAAGTPPANRLFGLASASPLPTTARATPSTRGVGFQPGSSSFQPGSSSFQPGSSSFQPGSSSFQPGRPLSQQSMATTAFFTVASSASLSSMATPGGTGLLKTISNMTSLSGFLDGTVHDGDPSVHNEPGLRSPFGDGAAATPFSSSYGAGGQPCLLTGDVPPYSPASAPFAPSPLAAAASPLAAAATTASTGADAASAAPMLHFYRDSAASVGGPPPLSAFDVAALHLPRTHSVHPPGFGGPMDGAPSLGTAASLGPAAPLLSAAHIPSDQLEVELPASSVAAPGKEPLLMGSKHGSQHGSKHGKGGVVAISINAVAGPGQPAPEAPADMSVMAGILHMMRDPHVAAFFFLTFLMGIGYGAVGYLMLYLKEQGAPGVLLGLCQTVNCAGEVLVLYTSSWWLARLGVQGAFNLAMAGWVLRLGGYVLVPFFPTPWLVLPLETLQGLTFGMAYCTGTVNCKRIAPPHLRSTTQSLFFSLYYGVGPGLSGLSGGYIYQALGMRSVFVIFSCIVLAGWLGTLGLLRCCAAPPSSAVQGAVEELSPADLADLSRDSMALAAPSVSDGAAVSAPGAAQLASN